MVWRAGRNPISRWAGSASLVLALLAASIPAIADDAGVVGQVGSVLGEGGINISRMQLALDTDRSEAAMLVNINAAPTDETVEKLRNLPNMISAQILDLGP